jgi:hypothetical protein
MVPKAKAGTCGFLPVKASMGVVDPVLLVGTAFIWSTTAMMASDSKRVGKTYDKLALTDDNLDFNV